ncbi:MAG: GntR family transcriptional regulator [Phycisphaerales bacterium]|nr:GntR family transcriptional regulator [Phycisphaerales bacterium]
MPVIDQLKQNQARELVLRRIRKGHYRPGQRLPSERELAQDLELSHITIRRGLQDLVEAGLIIRRPRIGTFVQETRSMELANRVAIVLPNWIGNAGYDHPFFPVLLRGIMSGLDQRDCAVSLISYQAEQFWHDAGEAMLARGMGGALVWTVNDIPAEQMEKLSQCGIKVVLLDGAGLWPRLRFSTVAIDLTTPMREAMQRLVDLGHRRIAWLSYEATRYRQFEERLVAEFAGRYELENPQRIIHRLPADPIDFTGYAGLLSGPNRPTAIIMLDEFVAHEVFRACHQLGVSVPGDVSLVAIADSAPRSHLVPLSAPDTSGLWANAARRAAEHLRHLMESTDDKQIDVSLHASIQWKASTDRPVTHPTGEKGSI